MEEFLRNYLSDKIGNEEYYTFEYKEDVNKDALTDDWLENRTSFIYKVGVLTAIDSNKCDFIHIVIGTQEDDIFEPDIKGYFHFDEGENDDVARVIDRAVNLLKSIHPVFNKD